MISQLDKRRLMDGDKAMRIDETAQRALDVVHAGLLALQSLDDLGEFGNKKAEQDIKTLTKKRDRILNRTRRI